MDKDTIQITYYLGPEHIHDFLIDSKNMKLRCVHTGHEISLKHKDVQNQITIYLYYDGN